MAIPDYQTLMLPVLRLAAISEQRVADAAERIAEDIGLTAAEREEMLPSGRQRLLHNRIHWAKFYMSKAGLVASPKRGRFIATDAGRALLASNPARIGVNELKDYERFREFYGAQKSADDDAPPAAIVPSAETGTPEEQIEAAHQAVQSALRAELLERIVQNSPEFF
ncbi:winged helix-turn-helix domain-containing protein [Paraburkholderia sp.]|uniref:winged helix-turn-helix domain-containing protein n=1 Tax=Paraburkholderia sp. TaxID=1926495 RepID=UPI002384B316|nr:winged helix-turn-helix domain-containing protein [Paraburkholderia sp.]MDE1181515.1 winged helix-turn-helix domain-containing protein [Paraburkholderia sp.]